ncbi:MAG TPA: hypothetical protein VFO86_04075, partial [Terriglobia bacterium]|nr:hypothetical protein [Terriglobia bacterium]
MTSAPLNIASGLAPSFRLVRRYFAASVFSFVVLCLLLFLSSGDLRGHHFQPKLLALTHIATLGWITMVIFGSMYQLIPVVLEVRVYSERMANIQFWIFSLGTVGLVYGFWSFNVGYLLAVSASLVTVGVLLFIVNVLATMSCITKWNLTGLFLLTAVAYLALTAVAGLLLAVNLGFPFI